MALDVALHLVLEGIGALALRCVLGICEHWRHRVAAWLLIAVPMSYLTVRLVG